MRAGDLDRLVTLQTRSETVDSYGGQSTAWSTTATFWACIQPAGGREILAAGGIRGETLYKVSIRYRTGIAPKQRLLLADGRTLNILSVNNVEERGKQMSLLCSDGLNSG